MKIVTPLIAALLITPFASAADLTVTIDNIQMLEGTIMLGLYDEAAYSGDGAVAGATLKVEASAVTTTFEGLAPGEYAMRLFHDLNDDGEMNTNPFGMPVEPYAFSNDARGRFGPAKWEAAKFTIGADGTSHTITMQ